MLSRVRAEGLILPQNQKRKTTTTEEPELGSEPGAALLSLHDQSDLVGNPSSAGSHMAPAVASGPSWKAAPLTGCPVSGPHGVRGCVACGQLRGTRTKAAFIAGIKAGLFPAPRTRHDIKMLSLIINILGKRYPRNRGQISAVTNSRERAHHKP